MVLLIPLAVMFVLGGAVGWALRPVRTIGPTTPSQAWIEAEKHARRVVAVAWVVVIVIPGQVVLAIIGGLRFLQPSGPIQAALPLIGGLAFLAVGAVGELTWPRPVGALRQAPLVRRRVRDVAPPGLSLLTATWALLLVLLLVVAGAVAGTGGRSLSFEAVRGYAASANVFPGWYYGRAIGVALALLLAATVGVLALVARRPPVSDTAPQADAELRRTSGRRVMAGVQLVVAWTFAGCLFFVGSSLSGVEPRWADAFGPGSAATIGHVLCYLALAIPVAAVVVAVIASRGRRAAPAPRARTALVSV